MKLSGLTARILAEGIGTYGLVFFGAGSIVMNEAYAGVLGHLGIALVFGAIVLAMIYAFGESSGAHINPAVTIAFSLSGRFPWKEVPLYVIAQSIGAVLAAWSLHLFFPDSQYLGGTYPSLSPMAAMLMEFILTYFLMLVIIMVSTGSKEIGTLAGIAISTVVMLEAAFAGPMTGASMNPARSLGPALVSGQWADHWLYWVGPIGGAAFSILTWKMLKQQSQE
ncbi:MIP family channel protein [bacterium SCSIO 12741]|nr:MIP family channel protein [bacterium SCSIO 12741]